MTHDGDLISLAGAGIVALGSVALAAGPEMGGPSSDLSCQLIYLTNR